jgi:uncharacterized membrane protein YccC
LPWWPEQPWSGLAPLSLPNGASFSYALRLFLLLAVVLAVAGIGWLKRRKWGWRFAVVIIATQVLGSFVNTLSGHVAQGAVGVAVAGGLFLYMTRPYVRTAFKG